MSTHPACTAHLSCRIPASISPNSVRTEAIGKAPGAFWVIWNGDRLGSIQEDIFGRWDVFAGGNAVPSWAAPITKDDAIRALLSHVVDSAFHWRMSLHG